jgi:hypothetical protein
VERWDNVNPESRRCNHAAEYRRADGQADASAPCERNDQNAILGGWGDQSDEADLFEAARRNVEQTAGAFKSACLAASPP